MVDMLEKQRMTVTNMLDNMIVDWTSENPDMEIVAGSKLDTLLSMRAAHSVPADPSAPVNDECEVESLSDALIDQSGNAQKLQRDCVLSISEKAKVLIKNRYRRLSLSNQIIPPISASENAHRLLDQSPARSSRSPSRRSQGTPSRSTGTPSRSPSVKRDRPAGLEDSATKIPKEAKQQSAIPQLASKITFKQ